MAQAKKKKKTELPEPDLTLDLGGGLELEVFGAQFEFTKKNSVGSISGTLICRREQLESVFARCMAKKLLTEPASREVRFEELHEWIEIHMEKNAVLDMEDEPNGIHVNIRCAGILFTEVAKLNAEIERLFPGEAVYFQ